MIFLGLHRKHTSGKRLFMQIKCLFVLWLLALPILLLWWFYTAKPCLESEFTNEIIDTMTFVLSAPKHLRANRQFLERDVIVKYYWDKEKQRLLITHQYLDGHLTESHFSIQEKNGKIHIHKVPLDAALK